jgi:hypothetical protein
VRPSKRRWSRWRDTEPPYLHGTFEALGSRATLLRVEVAGERVTLHYGTPEGLEAWQGAGPCGELGLAVQVHHAPAGGPAAARVYNQRRAGGASAARALGSLTHGVESLKRSAASGTCSGSAPAG